MRTGSASRLELTALHYRARIFVAMSRQGQLSEKRWHACGRGMPARFLPGTPHSSNPWGSPIRIAPGNRLRIILPLPELTRGTQSPEGCTRRDSATVEAVPGSFPHGVHWARARFPLRIQGLFRWRVYPGWYLLSPESESGKPMTGRVPLRLLRRFARRAASTLLRQSFTSRNHDSSSPSGTGASRVVRHQKVRGDVRGSFSGSHNCGPSASAVVPEHSALCFSSCQCIFGARF